jgi:hypothetical protein
MRIARLRSILWFLLLGSLAIGGRGFAQEQAPAPPAVAPAPKAPAGEQAATPKGSPKRSPRPGDVQKVFVVQHALASELAELLSVFPATITYSSRRTRAIAVSAAPAVMAAIEETLKRLDVPGEPPVLSPPLSNVELTGYVLEALSQPVDGAAVPAELEPAVAQLKRTFSYAAYRLVDTLIARAREGSGLSAKALGEQNTGTSVEIQRAGYELNANRARVSREATGAVVHLDTFSFNATVPVRLGGPNGSKVQQVGVRADIDIREGQRVVVGKSGVGEAGNAIILVLSARVVD